MNKTKAICYLSAIVLIFGCYALNLSYSLFVQTEEKNIVDSNVSVITYTLTPTTNTVRANSTDIITLKLTNTSSISFNYVLTTESSDNYSVKLYDEENNSSYGNIEIGGIKTIKLAITNNTSSCINVNFNLLTEYSTINIDMESLANSSNIDITNKYNGFSTGLLNTIYTSSKSSSETGATTYSEAPITTPLLAINNIDEASLIPSEDNYGKMFYYRGNVIDNYVNYAGKCWRIVRTTGDGGIKLILEDNNASCNSDTFTGNYSIGTGVFGYKTETVNSNSIIEEDFEHSIVTTSMYSLLENYQHTFVEDNLNYLANNEFCYENVGSSTNNIFTEINKSSFYNNQSPFYYKPYIRVYSNLLTFKCEENSTKTYNIDETTPLLFNTMTIDESYFSGLQANNNNQYNYLFNGNYISWWTISLSLYQVGETNGDSAYIIDNSSSTIYNTTNSRFVNQNEYNVRPTIILKSNVYATSGTGLKTDPYELGIINTCE